MRQTVRLGSTNVPRSASKKEDITITDRTNINNKDIQLNKPKFEVREVINIHEE